MPWSSNSPACAVVFASLVALAPSITRADESDGRLAGADVPRGTFVRMPPVLGAEIPTRHAGEPHILFLNRCAGGLTLDAGWPDDNTVNRSGILGGTTNFPEYPFGDGSWNQVVLESREIFAPFNIEVTDVDPSPAPHDEAVICGSGELAGFGGAGGVSPFTCDVIPSPITFTFPESLGDDPRTIAEVIAQEAAHAWGLEHEFKCEDPMTYLYGCGEKSFQDGDYPCGEYEARACECGGASQNAYQYILDLFGPAVPDTQAPTATITSPDDGDVFAVGDAFDIAVQVADDGAIAVVELYLDGELSSADMSEPYGPWPVIDAVAGSYEIYVVATDAAGKETMSGVVHFEVTDHGAPPDSGDDGGDGNGGDGGGGTLGDGGDGEGDGGGSFDGGGEPGALPPNYGLGLDDGGCACTAGPTAPAGVAWFSVLALLGLRRRSAATCR